MNGTYIFKASSLSSFVDQSIGIGTAFSSNDNNVWGAVGGRYSNNYIGTNSLGGISGEWLSVQFPRRFMPASYRILQATTTNIRNSRLIEDHSFLGSNDGGTTWTLLNRYTTRIPESPREAIFSLSTITASYSTYSLVVSKLGSTGGNATELSLNLRIYS
jgi:hypothetical protein